MPRGGCWTTCWYSEGEIGDHGVVVRGRQAIYRSVGDERLRNGKRLPGGPGPGEDIVDALVDLTPRLPGGEGVPGTQGDPGGSSQRFVGSLVGGRPATEVRAAVSP